MKSIPISRKRLIALALLLISVVTLFLDFAVITDRLINQMVGSRRAYNFSDMLSSALYEEFGSTTEASTVWKVVKALNSGGVSPVEARSLLSTFRRYVKSMGESVPGLAAASIGSTILLILLFLAFGLAVYGLFQRGAGGIFWFIIMQLILLGFEIYAIVRLNSEAEFAVLAFTAWPFIGLALSIASCVVCSSDREPVQGFSAADREALSRGVRNLMHAGLRFGKSMKREAANVAAGAASLMASKGWTCPQCGRSVEGGARFCSACGAQRPEKASCPRCGSESKPGAAFCPNCGTKLMHPAAAQQPQVQPFQQARPFQQPQFYQQAQPSQQAQPFQQAQSFQQVQPFQQPQSCQQAEPYRQAEPYQQAEPYRQAEPFQQAEPGQQAQSDGLQGISEGTMRIVVDDTFNFSVPLTFEVCLGGSNSMQVCHMNIQESLTVGRSSACDLQIDDATVSGRHLRLRREGENLFVTDLRSTNGSMLNGVPLTIEMPLKQGDQLSLGKTRMRINW